MKTIRLIVLMAFTAAFTACSDPMDEITNVEYQRAFSPIELEVQPGSFDQATVTWKSTDRARLYDVKLSLGDSLKFTNIVKTWEDIDLTRLSLTDLWGESQYSIAVKAKAYNEGQEDSHWTEIAFKTSAEQIFKTVKETEVKGTSAIVRFDLPHGQITRLTITPGIGQESSSVPLSATDVEAGYKELTGLSPNTNYKVYILNDEQKRGEVSVGTQWKPAGSEANVVKVNLGDDLAVICGDAANIGKIIYLPDGYIFSTSVNPGIVFAGDMTVYGDPDAAVKPKLQYTNSDGGSRLFTWEYKCNINELKIANIVLEGSGQTSNGAIVFGSASSSGSDDVDVLNAVMFERCDIIDWGRALYRVQGTFNNPIGLVSLNNCYAENVGAYGSDNGNYAFFTMNVGAGGINNIVVTNSTFKKIYHSFVNAPRTSDYNPCKNIRIENCTFNDFITGPTATTARIFIDGNNNTELTVNIKGVILGQSGPKSSGYRYGTGSTIAVSNTYTTTDYINEAEAQKLPSLVSSGISSASLFKNPAVGDFTIVNANFEGKNTSGDPRWR